MGIESRVLEDTVAEKLLEGANEEATGYQDALQRAREAASSSLYREEEPIMAQRYDVGNEQARACQWSSSGHLAENASVRYTLASKRARHIYCRSDRRPNMNLVVAQLLFLESENPDKDIHIYINSPGGSVTAGLSISTPCSLLSPKLARCVSAKPHPWVLFC